jgi:DNA-binding transcriptional LysR family regulator
MVDLVCLRSFAHVCESGTVAAAAERLGYTAPAVSQQLAKLERDLGVTLFDRAGGRLRPTERGRTLLDLAAGMLDLAERCRHLEPGSGRAEPISVAAFGSAVAEIVAPALRWLPAGAVVVRGVDDDVALRELRLGSIDVAVVQEYAPQPRRHDPRFAVTELARDELRLVVPPSWPAGTRLDDVGELPWLLNGDGTHCTAAVRHLLDAAGVRPAIAASVDDNRALLRLVAAGLGACIVPALVLAGSIEDVTVADERLGATRTIVAVTRRSSGGRADDVVAALRRAAAAAIGSLAAGAEVGHCAGGAA